MTGLMSSETCPTSSMIPPLKTMILNSMAPGPEDSATIREAKAAITQDLERRYTDPDLLDYLQSYSPCCCDRDYKDLNK